MFTFVIGELGNCLLDYISIRNYYTHLIEERLNDQEVYFTVEGKKFPGKIRTVRIVYLK